MPEPDNEAAIKAACTRFLSQHMPQSAADRMRALAASPHALLEPDVYGAGGAVAELERRTAELLGKPAGLFFAKGVTAQLCALRVHAEARGCRTVAIHPQSHLDVDEAGAIERVGGVAAIRLGRYQPFGLAAIEAVTERLAAVVIELPLRRSGYLLPPLEELQAISAHCREQGIPLHFDGARLWEAAAAYDVSLADLAALADSVYVSFYKGLGGLGGAMLLGSEAFIAAQAFGRRAMAAITTPPIRRRFRRSRDWTGTCRACRTTRRGRERWPPRWRGTARRMFTPRRRSATRSSCTFKACRPSCASDTWPLPGSTRSGCSTALSRLRWRDTAWPKS